MFIFFIYFLFIMPTEKEIKIKQSEINEAERKVASLKAAKTRLDGMIRIKKNNKRSTKDEEEKLSKLKIRLNKAIYRFDAKKSSLRLMKKKRKLGIR